MTARDPNDPGGFPEESFVGRTAELAWLRAAMARAATGHPAVVVVAGLPGIGKTALLRTFAAATCREFEGARVAAAGGEQSESQTAFAFVGQLARALGDTAPVAEKAEPMAVGARLLEAIGSASEAGPLLLVVDDLQWIDPASIDALVFALRRLGIDQVLAVLAVRSGGDEPTHSAIARLAGRPGSDLVTLTGLTAEEVGQLASALGAAALSHRGAGALAQHTGGVPLYVRALLEDVDIDELNAGGPFGLPAPRSFAAVISDRLGACSDSTRRLVEAGAVLGPGSSLALLAELAGVRPALADVDEAAAAKLLHEPRPGDPRVEFRHPLIQAAVYQIIPPARRAELHERAATLVGQSGDQWEALRHRAAASPGRDESLAAALADHAGQRLADGAIDAALAALLTAYRVARRGPSADGYLLRAADVMLASGDLARAAATVERARAAPDRCRRRFVEGSLAFFAGRRAEAERLLLEAWNGCGPDDGDVAGRVAARLGALALNEGRGEDTLRWTEQALALARPEDAARASAAAMRLMALGVMGREDTAEAVTASLPPVVRHPNLVESDMLLGRGVLRLWQGDALGAAGDLTAAVDAARGQGPLHALLMGLCYLAEAEFRTGRWDEAVTHAELAVSLGDDAGVPWTAALAHASAVAPMAARGQWKLAEAHVASAAGAADELGGTAALLWAGVARARLVHSSGRPAAVVAGLAPVWARREAPGLDRPGIQPWLALYAEGLAAAGSARAADQALALLDEQLGDRPLPGPLAAATRARAALTTSAGDHRASADTLAAGLEMIDSISGPQLAGNPLQHALVVEALGAALRRAGSRRAAIERLEQARSELAALDAEPYIERCDRELAACGLRPAASDTRARTRLTPQELAVARLVAEGSTNREVAAELLVSPKTVEYHLGNVYAKLGIRSRGGLRSALDRTGQA